MFDDAALNRRLREFDALLKAPEVTAMTGGPCEVWKKLRPAVVELISVLNGIGLLFPKAKLAAQALEALRSVLDSLCPGTAAGALITTSTSRDPLAMQLEQALRPAAAAAEAPCDIWKRVRPVVTQVISVLRALVPEFPLLGEVADALDTLSRLADSLCGITPIPAGAAAAAGGAGPIQIWEDDPYLVAIGTDPPIPAQPVPDALPNNTQPLLQTQVSGPPVPPPPPAIYSTTTPEFRYWNAQSALARGVNYWGPLLPSGTQWSSDATPLGVGLDQGADFNAFYSRQNGLNFFHGDVTAVAPPVRVFSGESPQVVCHELGHAILDAVKPELFDAMSAEVAAFHESFGDMSSMLSVLQLPSLRDFVLNQTGGRLNSNSRLSQLARQLGWAIRVQVNPNAVDGDSLRNAANQFFYQNPSGLPPTAPASSLSSEPHSFSRVFTGAFLDVLAGMYQIGPATVQPTPSGNLGAVVQDAGKLLIEGIRLASVVPGFYSQVAAGMVQADATLNGGRYRAALVTNFIRRGILESSSAIALVRDLEVANTKAFGVTGVVGAGHQQKILFVGDNEGYLKTGVATPSLQLSPVTTRFGLTVHVHLPAEAKRFGITAASVAPGLQIARSPEQEAQDFIEDLIQTGHISHQGDGPQLTRIPAVVSAFASSPTIHRTHYLVQEEDKLVLRRHHFDCGFGCRG